MRSKRNKKSASSARETIAIVLSNAYKSQMDFPFVSTSLNVCCFIHSPKLDRKDDEKPVMSELSPRHICTWVHR